MESGKFDNLLAIDTSSAELKLALSFGGDRLVKSIERVERSHNQVIIRKIKALLESADLQKKQLQGIVVSTGPGSFTGLRIGLAAAKGMAIALSIPIAAVSLFELAAYQLREYDDPAYLLVQVRKGEVLVGIVNRGKFNEASVRAIPDDQLATQFADYPVVGINVDIPRLLPGMRVRTIDVDFDAAELLYVGRERLEAGQAADVASLEPLYLQKSQAEIRFEQRHGQTGG